MRYLRRSSSQYWQNWHGTEGRAPLVMCGARPVSWHAAQSQRTISLLILSIRRRRFDVLYLDQNRQTRSRLISRRQMASFWLSQYAFWRSSSIASSSSRLMSRSFLSLLTIPSKRSGGQRGICVLVDTKQLEFFYVTFTFFFRV